MTVKSAQLNENTPELVEAQLLVIYDKLITIHTKTSSLLFYSIYISSTISNEYVKKHGECCLISGNTIYFTLIIEK